MALMLVIYQTPKDPAAFDKHYYNIHVPLAMKLPGLIKYEVSQNQIMSPTGHKAYLIGTLHFEDLAAIKTAFASPIGIECAADRKILAPNEGDVQMFIFESQPAARTDDKN
jgi:uncharacterized protein (TIGR02118 family)